ncbi:hypothetical protein TrCOL_g7350 [Triparma columacea]|uniref:Mitochondrial carrier protein n=1 Tax=Triparma columacea TaxID=722753 RepID=A0A9W7LFY3_9STRA|nr:hypothetical protein TrCOL_g7350 [Triparma columacea]
MITGGHYVEVLRLAKQMQGSKAMGYASIHKQLVKETGYIGTFYRGFWPWGVIQTVKGLPVLFVNTEVKHILTTKTEVDCRLVEPLAGVSGGIAQAFFVCPTQKLKVVAVADAKIGEMGFLDAVREVVKKQGIGSLYDGILAMCTRRGLDWCIRFTVSARVKEWFVQRRRGRGEGEELGLAELMGCGMVGGAVSAITHPIDCIITNAQKPAVGDGRVKRDPVSVAVRIYREAGWGGFGRGLGAKVLDNSYHTMWMYGIGTFVYEAVRGFTGEGGGGRE